jgi:hypothetical protein
LFRDGLHALALLAGGELVAAVPGAIVRLVPGEDEFRLCHKVVRGTRPLHIAASPNGACYWGEYFDNRERDEVRIYGSKDGGEHWDVVYTFGRGEIRHVHNIKYDRWENCIWILAGDNGAECRVLRASLDFRTIDTVLAGNQQCRAVGLVVRKDGLYFASDTPLETNHIFAMGRDGTVRELAEISSSSIFAGEAAGCMFVSTMVEPSEVNRDQHVRVYGSRDGHEWREVLAWKKDWLPMGLFQYGNAMFPDGENTTDVLALTTVATQERDLELSAWRVQAHS